jgi:ABC-2 type transport system ATP-binding protein
MDQPLLQVEDLSRQYGPLTAVNHIGFSVQQGDVLGFLGPNGAGKTTTMQMVTGNLAPTTGRIVVAGHDLLDDPRAAKSAIGYLPEQPPVYRELSVDEYLDACAAFHRIPRPRRRAMRDNAKEKCGLTDVGRRLIGNLSKGYQQRVGIAQAIIHLPPVIILDEPTAGLDPIQIREIRHLIRELGREHSVILSTHILPEVQSVCSRVQIISKGNLVLSDTIEGLARRMQSSVLRVRFRSAVARDLLVALPGVKSIEESNTNEWRLYHEPAQDPSDALVELAASRKLGLSLLAPEHASLEDIFVELTTEERATPEAAA